ncbi:MAG: nuclear transport factor 2 family protein [Chitinophagaceae bacterium]
METAEATMTIQEIANRLVEYCRVGNYTAAQEELFSEDAESIEPEHMPGLQTVKGRDAIVEKGKQFQSMVEEIHSNTVSDAVVAGNHFAVAATIDATMKGAPRSLMNEIAVYEVKDGKIVKEQFIY